MALEIISWMLSLLLWHFLVKNNYPQNLIHFLPQEMAQWLSYYLRAASEILNTLVFLGKLRTQNLQKWIKFYLPLYAFF